MNTRKLSDILNLVPSHPRYGETLRYATMLHELLAIHPVTAVQVAKQMLVDFNAACAAKGMQARVKLSTAKLSGPKNAKTEVMNITEALKGKKLDCTPAMKICRSVEWMDEEAFGNGMKRNGYSLDNILDSLVDYLTEVQEANEEFVKAYDEAVTSVAA